MHSALCELCSVFVLRALFFYCNLCFCALLMTVFVCRMATDETGVTSLIGVATDPVVLKRNSDDVGWEYGVLVDPQNKEKVWCLLCGHLSSGGIYRLKQHVGHVGSVVAKCKKTTSEAKEKCKKSLEEATRKRKEKIACDLNLREVNVSRVGEEDEITYVASGVGSSETHRLGPIDK
jgi:hypothetical protein